MTDKKWIQKQGLVIGVFFSILFLIHLPIETGWGDDVFFAEENMPLGAFLADRYRTWTSRVLIESGVWLLAAAPVWLWKILNILMILLLVWIAADLFGLEHGRSKTKIPAQVIFFSILGCLPVLSLCDAGWIATTLNYLWPMTLGLVAMRPVKHWIRGEKCPLWEYLACPVCMIYAANTEQGAAILLSVYLLCGAYISHRRGKLHSFYYVLLFCAAGSAFFILTTPGNAYRFRAEMKQWFPGFDELSLPEKLLMGFIDSVNYYASAGGGERINFIFALLAGILLAGILQKSRENGFRFRTVTAFVPFLFYWGIGQMGNSLLQVNAFKRGGHVIGLFGKNRCLSTGAGAFDYLGWISYSRKMVLLQAGTYLVLVLCVAFTIYFIHGKSMETMLELTILGIGLGSRIMMGCSPTIYASGERTSLYCSIAVLAVCLRNLQLYWGGNAGKREKALLGIYVAVVVCAGVWSSKTALSGMQALAAGAAGA